MNPLIAHRINKDVVGNIPAHVGVVTATAVILLHANLSALL